MNPTTDNPMMRCGHRANGVRNLPDGTRRPACVICVGIAGDDDWSTVDDVPPDLSGRTARCSYYASTPRARSREGPCGRGTCRCERPSDADGLAFFSHRPDRAHDEFYCGCWGWD